MKGKATNIFLLVSGVLALSVNALAHHGAAAYNTQATVEVAGKVTQFEFVNPHVLIYMSATGEDGSTTVWSGEITSPNRLARSERSTVKWSKDLLQIGDEIVLIGNPARNGAPSLRLLEIVDSDGRGLLGSDYWSERG